MIKLTDGIAVSNSYLSPKKDRLTIRQTKKKSSDQ